MHYTHTTGLYIGSGYAFIVYIYVFKGESWGLNINVSNVMCEEKYVDGMSALIILITAHISIASFFPPVIQKSGTSNACFCISSYTSRPLGGGIVT